MLGATPLARLRELFPGVPVIRVMPTLEPIREGFTQSGVPSSAQRSRQSASPTATKSTCGIPCPASRRFSVSLSMQVAELSTSEPT